MDSATALLPNVVGSLVYGGSHYPVNSGRGFFLHIQHEVTGDIHGDRDRGVPHALLDNLRVDLGRHHVAGIGVPHLVKCHASFAEKSRHYLGKVPGLKRRSLIEEELRQDFEEKLPDRIEEWLESPREEREERLAEECEDQPWDEAMMA